jgi:hypothetical protein
MKCTICAAAGAFTLIAFALLSPFGGFMPALAQQSPQQSQIVISYDEPTNVALRPIYQRLKQRHVLEELQAFMTPLRLPRKLTVRTAECGATTTEFKSQGPATICYEMVDFIEKLVAQNAQDQDSAQMAIAGAVIETVLHETAHGIFDVLQVPIWGREDDAADRLAALIMTQFGEDVTKATITGTTNLFIWSGKTWTGSDFSSTASPEYQRFFNYACIAYAADPLQFSDLVDKGTLPKDRADRCKDEYQQIRKAFDLRIMPYVDPDLLIKVRATPWLTWTPEK